MARRFKHETNISVHQLHKIDLKLHLVLIGHVTNDSYFQSIKSTIQEPVLENRVTIVPGLESASGDLIDANKAANVFLLFSTHEPFGIVILEAWAAGLPGIASKVGGVPAFVRDRVDSLLVEPSNSTEFVLAYQNLIQNRALQQAISIDGYQKAQGEYSWDTITKK
jgi:glycosyltransferase involved in cell wall biosynthesis